MNKNDILEKFWQFFQSTDQTTNEASENMASLESMSLNRLIKLGRAFGI